MKRVKKGWLYAIFNPDETIIRCKRFDPIYDSTDHLNFVCYNCLSIAEVIGIRMISPYGRGIPEALFFYLRCPECDATGQRKIYLVPPGSINYWGQILARGRKIFVYGQGTKPNEEIGVDQT
jgi:hypothetical protein